MSKLSEYLLSTTALVWGLVVLNPYQDAFKSSITFHSMAEVASEPIWGTCFILVGLVGLIVTHCCNSNIRRRRIALILNLAAWITLTVFYYLGNPQGTGYLAYASLAGVAIIASVEAIEAH